MSRTLEFIGAVFGYGCLAMVLGGVMYWAAYWIWRWIVALRELNDPFDVEGEF